MSDFVVQDKRLFNKDGRLNKEDSSENQTSSDAGETVGRAPVEAARPAETEQPAETEAGPAGEGRGDLPPVTFAGFIIGLASSTLIHLGEYPDPNGGAVAADLPAARQTIDLLGLLETKTKDNLDREEAELLKHLLYDLRVKYVKATEK